MGIDPSGRVLLMADAGDRWSDDPLERVEWQVNQIRQAVVAVAAVVLLAAALGIVAVVTA